MEIVGVRVVTAPPATARTLLAVALGVSVGTASGLVPGLHVNALALLLAGVAPALPGPPRAVAAAILAAGVVHSFLDAVPALALGVPDAAMATSALPGHRLVIDGRGPEAVRLSALGSAGAVLLAVPLAVPLTTVMADLYPTIRAHLPAVLAAVATGLVATEPTVRARAGALLSMIASGALGTVVLDWSLRGPLPVDSTLGPLFAGLFGAPILLDAARGGALPPQRDADLRLGPGGLGLAGAVGTLAGGVVGFLPGVSSGVAATLALLGVPGSLGDRGYVVAVSGVNTSNTIFALFALVTLRTPRTGVLVAVDRAGLPLNLPVLLVTVAMAAAAGVVLVVAVGDAYLAAVRSVDYRRLSLGVLALLAVLAYAFGGVGGVLVGAAAAVVGFLPPRTGARRVTLMGSLLVPLIL